MKLHPLLVSGLLALAPGLALAADVGRGAVLFNAECSSCHTAKAPPPGVDVKDHLKKAPAPSSRGPDLVRVVLTRPLPDVERWVKDPWAVKPETLCDSRRVTPQGLEDLMAFLASRTVPPPPPPEERARRALYQELDSRARSAGNTITWEPKKQPAGTGRKAP
jgi:mono/diheme cytochrome c family protein